MWWFAYRHFGATAHTSATTADDRDPTDDIDLVALAEDVLLVENAPTPLAALSPDGCLALANRSLRELLGYHEDIAGRPVDEVAEVAHCDVGSWDDTWTHRPVRLRRRDGTPLDARITTVVVRDDARVPRYLLCLIHAA
jgi:PAS domain-containing protein